MQQPWPILLLVRELGTGGCERDLCKAALGLDKRRFTVHVGCFHDQGFRAEELRSAGIPIVRFPVRSLYNRTALNGARMFGEYCREHRIVLSHAYDYPTNLFATPVGRFYRVPAVLASQLSHRGLRNTSARLMLRVCDRLAHRIVVNCQAMQRHMVEDWGVEPERVALCYNGVDTRLFYPPADGRPRPPALAGAVLVVGTVCVLRPEKRVDLLLRAFARVFPRWPQAHLAIVGSGPMRDELGALAQELGIQQACHFEPATPDVASWLRGMDLFVIPSASEAFSNALLEALACGCVPVGSRVGGNPELIFDQEHGLLFESGNVEQLADCLDRLLEDQKLRQQYAGAAAQFAAGQFSVERFVSTMGGLYEEQILRATAAGS